MKHLIIILCVGLILLGLMIMTEPQENIDLMPNQTDLNMTAETN